MEHPNDWRDRWRDRWRRRNDPQRVRAMFWQGIRHGLLVVRAVTVLLVIAVLVIVAWQALS